MGEPDQSKDEKSQAGSRWAKMRRRWANMRIALLGTEDSDWSIPAPSSTSEVSEISERAKHQRDELAQTRDGLRLWRTWLLFPAFVLPLIALLALDRQSNPLLLAGVSGYLEIFVVITILATRARLQDVKAELQVVEYDAFLVTLGGQRERSAANLFFKHQLELKRYYDLSLRQHRQAFVLGVLCVLFGLAVVIGAAVVVGTDQVHNTTTKIITAALGSVGAILTGFVATVYLGIYRGSADALRIFHQRLVETHHLHFANLLLSGVAEEGKRAQALVDLALRIPVAAGEL